MLLFMRAKLAKKATGELINKLEDYLVLSGVQYPFEKIVVPSRVPLIMNHFLHDDHLTGKLISRAFFTSKIE